MRFSIDRNAQAAILFVAGFLVFLLVLASDPFLPQYDAWYHARMATLVPTAEFFSQSLPWLSGTVLADSFGNFHFLFHVLLFPFASFGIFGVKLFTALLAGGFFCVFFFVAYEFSERYAFLGTLLMLSVPDFAFRLALPRAMGLSLILLTVSIYLLIKKRFKLLFLVSFIYVWCYTGVIGLLAIAGIKFLVDALTEKVDWRTLVYPFAGAGLGMVINPGFPAIFKTYFYQLSISFFPVVARGNEWNAHPIDVFLSQNWLVLGLLAVVIIFGSQKSSTQKFLLSISMAALFWALRSQRAFELWVPLICLYLVFAFEHISIPDKWGVYLRPAVVVVTLFVLLLAGSTVVNLPKILYLVHLEDVEGCATWIRENVPPGQTVFNRRWDDFPALFYYDPTHYYVSGLDPHFLYFKDPDQYYLYNDIAYARAHPIAIRGFGAEYLVSRSDDWGRRITAEAEAHAEMSLVFKNQRCYVVRVEPDSR
ncbi:MAG: hypothetical protein ABIC95_04430 [archaeon]